MREGDREAVEGVWPEEKHTPPVSFADSPLREGAKSVNHINHYLNLEEIIYAVPPYC